MPTGFFIDTGKIQFRASIYKPKPEARNTFHARKSLVQIYPSCRADYNVRSFNSVDIHILVHIREVSFNEAFFLVLKLEKSGNLCSKREESRVHFHLSFL
jgi:hypothetical protein